MHRDTDLEKLNEDEKAALKSLLILLEKVLAVRNIDQETRQNEFEKYINYFFQGKDILNPYERRKAGVEDNLWKYAKENFYQVLGIENGE